MPELTWSRLTSPDDPDIPMMRDILMNERYVSIDEINYFKYVTGTVGVYFYKIYCGGKLAAMLQAEPLDGRLSVMLTVMPEKRRMGIGKRIIFELCRRLPEYGCHMIEAAIESENIPSLRLFGSCGFRRESVEDELEIWVYDYER